MEEIIIGSHVSFKKDTQLLGSVKEALSYNANTFMFYTGAPQNTNRSELDLDITKEANELMIKSGINKDNVIVHAPYIINLANDSKNYDFAINFLKQEIKRVELLGIKNLVLHPGSHVGLGEEVGLKNIIFALNQVLDNDTKVNICLETMAGKGSELGINFQQLKKIIDGVEINDKIKVCLDTCHISDAGYDLENFDKVLDEFDSIIGLDKLACLHINDSKNECGAHKDRHENIGIGKIGFDNLVKIIYHPKLKGLPKILETPYITLEDKKTYPPYKFEIEMIRKRKFNPDLIKDIVNFYK